jgi:hypothetical protein
MNQLSRSLRGFRLPRRPQAGFTCFAEGCFGRLAIQVRAATPPSPCSLEGCVGRASGLTGTTGGPRQPPISSTRVEYKIATVLFLLLGVRLSYAADVYKLRCRGV